MDYVIQAGLINNKLSFCNKIILLSVCDALPSLFVENPFNGLLRDFSDIPENLESD